MSYNITYYNNYPTWSVIYSNKIITDDFNCDKINCNEITGNNAEFNNLKVNNNTITKNIVVSNYSTLNDVSLNNLTSYNITNTNLISTKDLDVDNNLTVNNNTSIIGDLSVGGNESLTGDLSVNNINSNNINNSNLITTNDLTYSTDYKNCKLYYVNYFNSFWGYATSASYTNNYLYLSVVNNTSTISGYTRTYKKYFVYKCVKDANNFYFDEIELDNNSLVYNIYSKKLYFVNDVNGTKYMKCLSIGQGTYRNYMIDESGEIFNDYENNKAEDYSHAEGRETEALSSYSHAEGHQTKANGISSHAEGYKCEASSYCSHAEGYNTKANSYYSHAEGYETETKKYYTHAGGLGTIADQECQTSIGKFNIKNNTNSLFSIGNGTDDNNRSDAFNVYQNGDCNITNDLSVGNNLTVSNDLTVNNDLNVSGDFNINGDITTNNLKVNNQLTLNNNIIYDNDYKNNRILIISNYFYGSDTTNINTQDKYYLCISTSGSYYYNKIYQCLTVSPLSTTEITPEDFLIVYVEIDNRYFIYFNNNWRCINEGRMALTYILRNSLMFNDYSNNQNYGFYSCVFGQNNQINSGGTSGAIVAGSSNTITGTINNSFVIGSGNKSPSSTYNSILSGGGNTLNYFMDRSIIYGLNNQNNTSDSSDTLLGGSKNYINGCRYSLNIGYNNNNKILNNTIIYGSSNVSTCSSASNNNLLGGNNNNINTITSTNNIISGDSNTLQTNNTINSIISGQNHIINGLTNTIISGNTNTNLNLNNSLIYGNNNISSSTSSSENNLLGGYNNNINTITSTNNIISGNSNTLQTNNTINSIISGQQNTIDDLTNSIVSGQQNTVKDSNYSIIMGNNNISNYSNNSLVLGNYNKFEYNDNSLIMGNHNIYGYNGIGGSCFLGNYNKDEGKSFIFNISNGNSNERRNCFNVDILGRTKLRELSFYDTNITGDPEIFFYVGYVMYYLNGGTGDKVYRALSQVIVDKTNKVGVFWSAPIYMEQQTNGNPVALGAGQFNYNGYNYFFRPMNYNVNYYGSGFVNTAQYHQSDTNFKLNSWRFGAYGQTWTNLSSAYASGSYPVLSMCATYLYLTTISAV